MCVCVCVFVCERGWEGERETERDRRTERGGKYTRVKWVKNGSKMDSMGRIGKTGHLSNRWIGPISRFDQSTAGQMSI